MALVGLVLLMPPQMRAEAEQTVSLGSIEYPPYTGPDLEQGGPLTQIVREAYERVGYQVQIQYYPWSRATSLARRGSVDGLVPIWMREERKEWVLYSDPMPASEVVFYKRKDTEIVFDGSDYSSLKPYVIGTVQDYANPEGLERVREQLQIQAVMRDIQNLRKLASGRVDLAVIDRYVARHLLREFMQESVGALDSVTPPLSVEPNYLGASRAAGGAEQKLADFNRGLGILTKEGRIAAILKAHGLGPVLPDSARVAP